MARRQPHHHEIRLVPVPPDVPFAKLRALYCRLSDDDDDSVSIEHQIEAGMRYAEAHGLCIAIIYIDWRTGRDPDRIAFRQLIADAKAGRHAGVIFYDDTRLHRELVGAFPVVYLHLEKPEYLFAATDGVYDIEEVG